MNSIMPERYIDKMLAPISVLAAWIISIYLLSNPLAWIEIIGGEHSKTGLIFMQNREAICLAAIIVWMAIFHTTITSSVTKIISESYTEMPRSDIFNIVAQFALVLTIPIGVFSYFIFL
jgi:succinate dehydrogenase hydrophobic anchor subunit